MVGDFSSQCNQHEEKREFLTKSAEELEAAQLTRAVAAACATGILTHCGILFTTPLVVEVCQGVGWKVGLSLGSQVVMLMVEQVGGDPCGPSLCGLGGPLM